MWKSQAEQRQAQEEAWVLETAALVDFPLVDLRLVAALQQRYPNRCPMLTEEDRVIWMNAGFQLCIDTLSQIHAQQVAQQENPHHFTS